MPRRNRISFEQRQRIVGAYENDGQDYLIVSDTLGVNRSTARSIVDRYLPDGRVRERPRCGANNVRVHDEMRDCVQDILNENCLLTLTQMNEELRRRLTTKHRIHDRTVAQTLEGMLFSLTVLMLYRNDMITQIVSCATP